MSWTRFAATVSAAVLAGWTTTALAQDHELGRSGPYIGAGGSYAFSNFSYDGEDADGSGGYQLKAGYRFNEWFALEVDWQHFIEFPDTLTGDTDMFLAAANGKFFPLHGIVQPYLLVGAGYQSINNKLTTGIGDKTSGVAFNFAGGLDVYLHRNFALYAQAGYILGTGDGSDYGVIPLTFGFMYRFF